MDCKALPFGAKLNGNRMECIQVSTAISVAPIITFFRVLNLVKTKLTVLMSMNVKIKIYKANISTVNVLISVLIQLVVTRKGHFCGIISIL